jgi:hypothetical protein
LPVGRIFDLSHCHTIFCLKGGIMKIVLVGLFLLCTLALAGAATVNPSPAAESKPALAQSAPASDAQLSKLGSSPGDQSAAILSRAEADSLRMQGDSLFAQSGVREVKVGAVGGDDLIYILVVVLLVVVILAVVR